MHVYAHAIDHPVDRPASSLLNFQMSLKKSTKFFYSDLLATIWYDCHKIIVQDGKSEDHQFHPMLKVFSVLFIHLVMIVKI